VRANQRRCVQHVRLRLGLDGLNAAVRTRAGGQRERRVGYSWLRISADNGDLRKGAHSGLGNYDPSRSPHRGNASGQVTRLFAVLQLPSAPWRTWQGPLV